VSAANPTFVDEAPYRGGHGKTLDPKNRLRRERRERNDTGQAAKKKCKERELLKLAYWKINRPK
jgi:hypothetical protein